MRRREFLKQAAVGSGTLMAGIGRAPQALAKGMEAKVPSQAASMKLVPGERYEALVPDTLDLADRGALSVNTLTGAASPEYNYETAHNGHVDQRPAFLNMWTSGPCHPKVIHVLPMMRVMSGSTQNADYDDKMLEVCVRNVEKDNGLWWLKKEGRPWHAYGEDVVWAGTSPRVIFALIDRHKLDGDKRWLDLARQMVGGLAKIASGNEDRAWYPYNYRRGMSAVPEPPDGDLWINGQVAQAMARWYMLTGDKSALRLSRRLVNEVLKPERWGTGEGPTMVSQAERGPWRGHFHSTTRGMFGVVEYGIATHDDYMLEFSARVYEWARFYGIANMGFFPGVIGPKKAIMDQQLHSIPNIGTPPSQNDEACGIGNMIWLAVRLSEAGIGDYWDDADQYVRNHLVEHQMIDRDLLKQIVDASPPKSESHREFHITENALERNLGSFASVADPTWLYAWWTMCCNTNAPEGMYKAWEAIIRCTGDVAQVNLLLNRASPWMDIDSYLPYEGKVVLKNKTARKAHVRIPRWVDKHAVRLQVNGQDLPSLQWLGNYVLIEKLTPGDRIEIKFPIIETTERWAETTYETTYTCKFKGSTLVDISPQGDRPAHKRGVSDDGLMFEVAAGYPMYRRDYYKGNETPMNKKTRFVSQVII